MRDIFLLEFWVLFSLSGVEIWGGSFGERRERKGGIGCVPLVVFVEISTFLGNVEMSV